MQTVYRVYKGTREPHRLAVERAAEVLGRGGLVLIPTETVYGVAVAVNAFSDAVPKIQANPCCGRAIRMPPLTAPRSLRLVLATAASLPSSSASSPKRSPAGRWRRGARPLWRGYPGRCPRTCATMLAGSPDYRGQGGPLRADLYACCRRHRGPARFGLSRGPSAHPRLRQSPCLHERQHTRRALAGKLCRRRRSHLEGVDVAVDAGETPVSRRLDHRVVPARRAPDPAPRRTSRIRDRTGPVRPDAIERCKRCR